jgi:hypothetical protein
LGYFVKNPMAVAAWVCVEVFCSIPLVFMSVFVPEPCCFYYYGSVVWFEVRYCDTSSIALLDQDYFGYSWSFVLPNEL